ncbi:Gfo/Idh/MocA family oxidoreductase [Ferruginibacter lapsinanis]|uniref:Gfo/Idh/MocA family protein n=1 Tax=Ferruginibacter lapsinanis TaxID=563172 RepID=UPI001E39131F|nr:Gfo/Idh/MocA family oxidoreductase [Ferruginibacter lapsinanis]UEG48724.1 Gfo/Idh/MocA family oxidoreductase [Ferruginibacter lapsinanis]
MPKKNIAIVGCGRIGQRHAEQIAAVGTLKAVCDIIPEKAYKLSSIHQCNAYLSIEDLLNAEKNIDVISICTPNGLHALHAIKALESGVNVLCEKPLCIKVDDGKKMIAAAARSGKKLFVVKQNRYNPPVEFLKKIITENKLGKIYSFQINCFWNRPEEYYTDWKGTKTLDGGTLFTQFSHFIDLLYWLLGDVREVKKITQNFAHPSIEFEDTGAVIFAMANGSIGTLNYTVNSFDKNMEGSFTVFAEKGTLKIGGEYLNELEYFKVQDIDKPNLPKGNLANGYGFYKGSMSNHDKVYQNLIIALDNPQHDFASAEEGLKTVEIIEKIYSE